jgi:hypothetical protein
MKANTLPNLRGLIGNNNRLKIELTKAINIGQVYSKRGPGYSPASEAIATLLTAALAANKTTTRSASIALASSSGTLAAGAVVPQTVTATWADASTQVVARPATAVLTFGAVPANNDTVTLDGRVYTYKTTLTGAANEILIGADVTASATNLRSALNGQTGAGSLYGTGTAVHASLRGSNAVGVLTVFPLAAGADDNTKAVAKSGTNPSLSGATLTGGVLDTRVTFVSSDVTKATVNTSGRISRVAAGSATITASFQGRTAPYAATLS